MERERRAHPRKLVSTGVSFNDLEGATLRGWLHDISRGGCFVATPSLFTFGEELTIVMTLPFPRQRVQGKVRVAWIREKNDKDMPAGMGLAFVDVNEDALVAIDKLATTPKLSRPKTVIGIAPPAAGSSPSYSDVQIPLPTPEELAKPLAVPGLDAGVTEPEGVPLVKLPEPEPEPAAPAPAATEAETEAKPEEPLETEPMKSPFARESQPEPKKSRREKLLIGGAAAVSVAGLVTLGVIYTRHGSETATDAATSATAVVEDAAPIVPTPSSVAVVAPPPPIPIPTVDAGAHDAGHDGGPRDAGADAGKKKPVKPKVKPKR